MKASEAAVRIYDILEADLEQLTESGRLSVLPSEAVECWGISQSDVELLRSYGLPPVRHDGLLGIAGAFQASAKPSLEGGLFAVGAYGVTKLGLSSADGSVWTVSRYSPAEIHPQLRALHTHEERTQLVNSTLGNFVEFSWRWYWILPVLAERQIAAGDEEVQAWSSARSDAERSLLPDFYADLRNLCGKILGRFEVADRQVRQAEGAFWRTVVMEYL
ncbi:SUKH-4 family immunity protein [Streptomyces sp. NPDC007206]|uniref:SUKH-4 family immunity protein n=1 Tax=Streptomyces sp. NPDC007206 TaxID=3154317 RepID=UPI0033F8FD53